MSSGLMASSIWEASRIPLTPLRHWIEYPKGAAPAPLRNYRGGKTIRWSPHPLAGYGIDGQLIRHRPGRNKKRGPLFPRRWATFSWRAFTVGSSPRRHLLLLLLPSRSHGRSRSGDGITSEIDQVLHHSSRKDSLEVWDRYDLIPFRTSLTP